MQNIYPASARHLLAIVLIVAASLGGAAQAGSLGCKLKFSISGWAAFYKRSSGSGTVTCDNGQTMRVRLEARGGGPAVGKATIKNGKGDFAGVNNIHDVLGSYVSAEAAAGAVKSAKGQVVTKGEVSLALSGTGEGWEIGVAFGKFSIYRR